MRQVVRLMIMALSLSGLDAEAVAAEPLVRAGDRVRIQTPFLTMRLDPAVVQKRNVSPFVSEHFLVGTVEAVDEMILRIRMEGGDSTTAISLPEVTRLEVWSAGTRKTAGTLAGLLGGAILGGVIGHTFEEDERESGDPRVDCNTIICGGSYGSDSNLGVPPTVTGVVAGGLIGAVAGGWIGATMTRDQWSAVDVRQLRARITAEPGGGIALLVSVSL